jgi:hypothetical protein
MLLNPIYSYNDATKVDHLFSILKYIASTIDVHRGWKLTAAAPKNNCITTRPLPRRLLEKCREFYHSDCLGLERLLLINKIHRVSQFCTCEHWISVQIHAFLYWSPKKPTTLLPRWLFKKPTAAASRCDVHLGKRPPPPWR